MTARRWTLTIVAAIALLLVAGRAVAAVYVDYRWYDALGAGALWRMKALTVLLLRAGSGLLAAGFAFANLYALRRSLVSVELPRRVANIEIREEVPGRYLVGIAAVLAVGLGALLTMRPESWTTFALARIGIPFGELDPYFENDLGFFVYWLPLETAAYFWALMTVLLITAVVVFLYALTPSLRWQRGALYVSNYVRRHLVVLCSLLLLLLAWSYRLDAFKVLLSGNGAEGAFTYADRHAIIPLDIIFVVLITAAAAAVLVLGWSGMVRAAFGAVGAVLLLALLVRPLGPVLARYFAPGATPAAREEPYLRVQSEYARRAFGVDHLARSDSTLAFTSLREATPWLSVWDPAALARAVNRSRAAERVVQGVGWEGSAAGLVALLPERPAGAEESETELEPWSVARVLAAAADDRGEPVRIPPATGATAEDQLLDSVLVYEGASGYLVVPDSIGRVAAPELGSGLSRLAHAWSMQNFRLLFGDLPRPGPRIITVRDVRHRVAALAPFFAQGTNIAPLVADDTLYWVTDLYAVSAFYPLSLHVPLGDDEYTYLRHAATAIVNARTGRVAMVADSARDPIGASWMRAFPSLFVPWTRLPDRIVRALPAPVELARAQAAVLARYGVRGEAPREGRVPNAEGVDTSLADSAEVMFTLPRQATTLAWTVPVLDDADRVTGAVMALGGRERSTRWVPGARSDTRWPTTLDLLRRAADSSASFPRDARAMHGRVRTIPMSAGLAFMQPVYAWRADAAPTLARVAVVSAQVVATGRTLADAAGTPRVMTGDSNPPVVAQDFRARVAALYEQMRVALQRGDWVAFGRAYDALGTLLGSPH